MSLDARAWRSWSLMGVGAVLAVLGPDAASIASPVIAASLLVGLPHGAVDHRLAEHTPDWRGWRGQASFHLTYLLSVAAVLLGWALAPVAGLLLLLASAAWHFGESDLLHLHLAEDAVSPALTRGLVLVLGPLLLDPQTAMALFASVAGKTIGTVLPIHPGPSSVLLAGILFATHLVSLWRHTSRAQRPSAVRDALAVVALVYGGGPVLGFALYFVLWHTPDHFVAVAHKAERSGWDAVRWLAWEAAPRTGVALAGLALLVGMIDPSAWARLTVWTVAALTLPHALVVHLSMRTTFAGGDAPAPAP